MRFTWDGQKNQRNQRDHQVSFELAREVFADPLALSTIDRVEDGEQRWQTVGMVGGVVILLVAHTGERTRGRRSHPYYLRAESNQA